MKNARLILDKALPRSAVQFAVATILACAAGAASAEEAAPNTASHRAAKTFKPRPSKEAMEKRMAKAEKARKKLGRNVQRATPGFYNFEGPRSLEEELEAI